MSTTSAPASKENPLINLLASVAIPVFVLNKFSSKAPVAALLIALAFPIGYGLWSFYQSKKINFISVLGILNTVSTGGFALMELEGIWFCVKEAAVPLLIGLFVFFTAFGSQPFLQILLMETGALNAHAIDERTQTPELKQQLQRLVKKSTLIFSTTFFFSAIMNFIIAYRTFLKIPLELSAEARTEILNQQIASMTWKGYAMIFVPTSVIFFVILYFFFRGLTKVTGLTFDEIIKLN